MIKPKKVLLIATTLLLSILLFKTCSKNKKSLLGMEISPDSQIEIKKQTDRNDNVFNRNEAHSDNEARTYEPDAGCKKNPVITCPVDVNITCAEDYTNLNTVGEASAIGSCGSMPVEYNDITTNISVCNEGFIIRRWNVIGVNAVFCDQIITIAAIGEQTSVSFAELGDKEVSGCPDQNDLGEPLWIAGSCDVIGYSLETDTFLFEDGACYKLVNTYTVINWCDYNPGSPWWVETDDFTDGLVSHTQIVKMTDETIPVLAECEDFIFEINDHDDSDNDGNVCEAKIILTNSATDPGSDNCPSGWLKWQVFVDLWADGTDDLEFSSFLPPFDSQFNDTNGNGIPDIYTPPTESGEEVSISLPDIEGAISLYKVRWKVIDGCNNIRTCDFEFLVKDGKAPIPFCIDTSIVEINANGYVPLWATDLNISSFDNCTSDENLRYTFSDTAPQDDPLYDPSRRSSYRTFDLSDASNSPLKVNMYVWDEKDNYDFCIVNVIVDYISINSSKNSGRINTEERVNLFGVDESLNILYQNEPNPFGDFTTIGFDLASSTSVTLKIINSTGAIITTIDIDGKQGYNTYHLDRNVVGMSGLYFYRLECDGFMETKKMIMVR